MKRLHAGRRQTHRKARFQNRRLFLEPLEDRRLLALCTGNGIVNEKGVWAGSGSHGITFSGVSGDGDNNGVLATGTTSTTISGTFDAAPPNTHTAPTFRVLGAANSPVSTPVTSTSLSISVDLDPGLNTLTFQVTRGSSTATVVDSANQTIEATLCVNRNPVANNDTATTDEDVSGGTLIAVKGNDSDADNDTTTVSLPSNTSNQGGTLAVESNSVRYTPAKDFNGTDTFSYNLSDGNGGSDSATVTVTVNPVNDPPVAEDFSVVAAPGQPQPINVGSFVSDVDGTADISTLTVVTPPPAGDGTATVVDQGGIKIIQFNAAADFSGSTTLEYSIEDDQGLAAANPGTITIGAVLVPSVEAVQDDTGFGINDFYTADTMLTVSGRAEPGATVDLLVDGLSTGDMVVAGADPSVDNWQFTPAGALTEGPHTLQVRTTIASSGGNEAVVDSDVVNLTIDITNPTLDPASDIDIVRQAPNGGAENRQPVESARFTYSEPVVGIQLSAFKLVRANSPDDLLPGSSATVDPTAANVPSMTATLADLATVTNQSASYTLTLDNIDDRAGNAAATAQTRFVVDVTDPILKNLSLDPNSVFAPDSQLSVPLTQFDDNPSLSIHVKDQQFAFFDNEVQLQVCESADISCVSPLGHATVPISANSSREDRDLLKADMLIPLDLPEPRRYSILVRATDTAGRTATSDDFVFDAVRTGLPSRFAPNTPVASYLYDLSEGRDENGNQPFANSNVEEFFPWQMGFDKTTQTVWFTMELGTKVGQFDPATGSVYIVDLLRIAALEEGLDVSENRTDIYSVDNPHGVFFDFNTHLTPRVWYVNRAASAKGLQQRGQPTDSRISYLDAANRQLVHYDFGQEPLQQRIKATALSGTGDDNTPQIRNLHAVFVDTQGDTWAISDEDSRVLHFDFQQSSGSGTNLDARNGSLIVRQFPEILSDDHFHPHGVEVIIDDETRETYVWIIAEGGSNRIALLRPASQTQLTQPATAQQDFLMVATILGAGTTITVGSNGNTEVAEVVEATRDGFGYRLELAAPLTHAHDVGETARSQDRWTTWDVDLPEELRGTFLKVDDQETPGNPKDDVLIATFPVERIGTPAATKGILYELDPDLDPITGNPGTKPELRVWQLPTIPSVVNMADPATLPMGAVNQPFVDREGRVIYIDRLGAVGRLDRDVLPPSTTDDSLIIIHADPGIVAEIGLEPTGTTDLDAMQQANPDLVTQLHVEPTLFDEDVDEPDTPLADDRAGLAGLDLYEVAGQRDEQGIRGFGAFRAALNATGVFYTSLSQNDLLGATIFAETGRRSMSVVASPYNLPVGARVTGRMAFQTLRDGSVILTARGDGRIVDDQVNLTRLIAQTTPGQSFQETAFAGDPSAIATPDGQVYVFGVSQGGRLLAYHFQGPAGAWQSTSALLDPASWKVLAMNAPANGILSTDPTAYVDPLGQVGALIPSSTGRLLHYEPVDGADPVAVGPPGSHSTFSRVGVTSMSNLVLAYGSNMLGDLVEFSFPAGQPADGMSHKIEPPAAQQTRQTRIFQDIAVVSENGTRHVFGQDGTSRLVHYRLVGDSPKTLQVTAVNVTLDIAATFDDNEYPIDAASDSLRSIDVNGDDRAFGYFPFQEPFVGRTYSGLAPLIDVDGSIFVYGSNGQDIILFRGGAGSEWTAHNLTNDVYSFYGKNRGVGAGQATPLRIAGNGVFGGSAAYITNHASTLNAAAPAGASSVLLNDWLPPETEVLFERNSAVEEIRTITSVTPEGSLFRAELNMPLGNAHAAGSEVIQRRGARNILQINGDGEVVEYYIFPEAPDPETGTLRTRFHTQNITLLLGNSSASLQGPAGPPPAAIQAPTDTLGPVQFFREAIPLDGSARLAFEATHSGTLAAEGLVSEGEAELVLLDARGNVLEGSRIGDPSTPERLDAPVLAGESYLLVLHGQAESVEITIGNQATRNSPLTLHGREQSDTFAIDAADTPRVEVNGLEYRDTDGVASVHVRGEGGHDVLALKRLRELDVLSEEAGLVVVNSAEMQVRVETVEQILVDARSLIHGRLWTTNPRLPGDTNGDLAVTPLDALQIVNVLNLAPEALVPLPLHDATKMLDTNGDGSLTPLDVLVIVNRLNEDRFAVSAGEGEAGVATAFEEKSSLDELRDDSDVEQGPRFTVRLAQPDIESPVGLAEHGLPSTGWQRATDRHFAMGDQSTGTVPEDLEAFLDAFCSGEAAD